MTVDLIFKDLVSMRYAIFYVFNYCEQNRKANTYGIKPGANTNYDFPNLKATVTLADSEGHLRSGIVGLKNGTYPAKIQIVRTNSAAA